MAESHVRTHTAQVNIHNVTKTDIFNQIKKKKTTTFFYDRGTVSKPDPNCCQESPQSIDRDHKFYLVQQKWFLYTPFK